MTKINRIQVQLTSNSCKSQLQSVVVFFITLNSVQHNADILAHLLSNSSPNVTVITEHGLAQENKKNTKIEGYSLQ